MPPNLRRGRDRLPLHLFKSEVSFFLVEGIVSTSGDAGGLRLLLLWESPSLDSLVSSRL